MAIAKTDNGYTTQVKKLLAQFCDNKAHPHTILSDAEHYYSISAGKSETIHKLAKEYNATENQQQRSALQEKIKQHERDVGSERIERVERLNTFIDSFLNLVEANTEKETHHASAKFLGTLLLITDCSKSDAADHHQLLKPLYKAVLALRLTDDVLKEGKIKHNYLGKYIDCLTRFTGNRHWRERWRKELAYPIVKAALLQDIGLHHPTCEHLLLGPDKKKDPYRLLEEKERKHLLKLNLNFSLAYLKKGLGMPAIKGADHQEIEQKTFAEQQALSFAMEVVQDATILKNHVGDIIKIPQIYASFVLSTKFDYDKKDLPKGYMVIEQLMKKGTLQNRIAASFLNMVGYFPQGYGVAFIAEDEQGHQKDNYEFAVVNRLYPDTPSEPHVRVVTRNLNFIYSGKDVVVKRHQNLYFQNNHKKLERFDKARLDEIKSQLTGGHAPQEDQSVIPQLWEPYDFFQEKKNQNLWSNRH